MKKVITTVVGVIAAIVGVYVGAVDFLFGGFFELLRGISHLRVGLGVAGAVKTLLSPIPAALGVGGGWKLTKWGWKADRPSSLAQNLWRQLGTK